MPLGKYYCDYCDKQFQDTPAARRRHVQGLLHQKNKARWYDIVQGQASDLTQFAQGGVCNRFVRTGTCQYGDSCKYYHPKNNAQNSSVRGSEDSNFMNPSQTNTSSDREAPLPAMLFGNLPPSLAPPPVGGFPNLPFVDWG